MEDLHLNQVNGKMLIIIHMRWNLYEWFLGYEFIQLNIEEKD